MKKTLFFALMLVLGMSSATTAQDESYIIDNDMIKVVNNDALYQAYKVGYAFTRSKETGSYYIENGKFKAFFTPGTKVKVETFDYIGFKSLILIEDSPEMKELEREREISVSVIPMSGNPVGLTMNNIVINGQPTERTWYKKLNGVQIDSYDLTPLQGEYLEKAIQYYMKKFKKNSRNGINFDELAKVKFSEDYEQRIWHGGLILGPLVLGEHGSTAGSDNWSILERNLRDYVQPLKDSDYFLTKTFFSSVDMKSYLGKTGFPIPEMQNFKKLNYAGVKIDEKWVSKMLESVNGDIALKSKWIAKDSTIVTRLTGAITMVEFNTNGQKVTPTEILITGIKKGFQLQNERKDITSTPFDGVATTYANINKMGGYMNSLKDVYGIDEVEFKIKCERDEDGILVEGYLATGSKGGMSGEYYEINPYASQTHFYVEHPNGTFTWIGGFQGYEQTLHSNEEIVIAEPEVKIPQTQMKKLNSWGYNSEGNYLSNGNFNYSLAGVEELQLLSNYRFGDIDCVALLITGKEKSEHLILTKNFAISQIYAKSPTVHKINDYGVPESLVKNIVKRLNQEMQNR